MVMPQTGTKWVGAKEGRILLIFLQHNGDKCHTEAHEMSSTFFVSLFKSADSRVFSITALVSDK